MTEDAEMEAVAVIGMVGRVPGAADLDELWQVLVEGRSTIRTFAEHELAASVSPEDRRDPQYVRARGVLEGAELFDGAFFGMSPVESLVTDPQQRLFLEACWEVLEHAGYPPDAAPGMVGVFGGMGNNSYYPALLATRPDLVERFGPLQVMLANEKDYLTTRVAYKLGLTGPAVNVYAACSTSLLAVCEAFHSLLAYRCDMALAGGVTVYYPQERGYRYQAGAITSGDGSCRPFDADAAGTVFSSGLGVVALRRLSEAIADRDTIYAVIRGVGVNNDGARRTSFSAPSVDGQAEAIAMAHASAGIRPEDVGYVEAHGTATHLGDPLEIEALTKAFGPEPRRGSCAIGALKGNVGHLDAAAGVAGLLKTILVLRHGMIPAVAHFTRPNPRIDFASSPFYVSDRLHAWPAERTLRLAGVSSFGTGGTNAHVVVEGAPDGEASGPSRPYSVLCLSARSSTALDAATDRLADHLERHPQVSLGDVAYTLQVGRSTFRHRRAVAAKDVAGAVRALRERGPLDAVTRETAERPDQRPVVFMFPGQGSQYVGMGSGIYAHEPVFRAAMDRCVDLFAPVVGADLREVLFAQDGEAASERLRQTVFSQSGLFTVEYALAQLWRSWGVDPVAMIGHSVGEFVAACVSGVFSLEDAVRMVGTRGKLMQAQPTGAMLSVRLPATDVAARLTPDCGIAAINGPALCVVSGPEDAIAALETQLAGEGIVTRRLHTSHAFHSPMMDAVVEPFARLVRTVRLSPPSIPFVSTVTADWITDEQATDPEYWAGHLRATVRFAEGVAPLWADRDRLLLEVGPRATLTTLARQQAQDLRSQLAVPSLGERADDEAEWRALALAVGQLWAAGRPASWDRFYEREKRRRIALPTYPFERSRYWIDPISVRAEHDLEAAMDTSIPSSTNGESVPTSTNGAASGTRADRILAEVVAELEAGSGIVVARDQTDAMLLELGFDSLMLTQVSLSMSKRFKVELSFRQLLEDLASPRLIAEYLDGVLPPSAFPAATPASGTVTSPMKPITGSLTGSSETVDQLIAEQLEIMRRQLDVLVAHGRLSPESRREIGTATPTAKSAPEAEVAATAPAKPFGAAARIDLRGGGELTAVQREWLKDFTARYTERTARSRAYTSQHREALADPRVVSGFSPLLKELVYPIVVDRADGSRLWDLDGNEYVDMVNGFGSNFLGHSSPVVVQALREALDLGFAVGPQHPLAGEVADLMKELTGHPRVAFCNTGSEAVLGAMRTARTVTGRSTVVLFRDSYHGIFDEVVVRGGAGLRSFPAAPGIPRNAVDEMLVLDYGEASSLDVIRERADSIAAVLVEPVQSRRLDLQPREFLHQLREITAQAGIALVFDEVITGFRVSVGGAQEYFGVRADIATYGKVVGGGLPIGVIAGAPRFMDALDGGSWQFGDDSFPAVGVTYFAGTFVRHPLALTAARAVLGHLKASGDSLQNGVNDLTMQCVSALRAVCAELGAPISIAHFSSAFQLSFTADAPFGALLFPLLRERGIHMFEGRTWFLTAAHTTEEVDYVVSGFRDAVSTLLDVGLLLRAGAATASARTSAGVGAPPTPDARLGRDPAGRPGWYRPDPDRPGKFILVAEADV